MENDTASHREKRRGFRKFFNGGRAEDEPKTEHETEQEIMSMVEKGHEKGVLHESEAFMIHNVFALDDKEAGDIMTHRKNIIAIDGSRTLNEVLQFVRDREYSRYPVFLDSIDNVIGTIHIKDLLRLLISRDGLDRPLSSINGLVREVPFIPETRHIDELFRSMQSQKFHMVIVVDEYGQTAGLVTMEDILEELVGNIMDEYDREDGMIVPQKDGSYIMNGETEMEDVCRTLQIHSEKLEEFDTLNGFLVSKIDKIPSEGEVFSVSAYGYSFQVLQVDGKMIKTVRVRRLPEEHRTPETEGGLSDDA